MTTHEMSMSTMHTTPMMRSRTDMRGGPGEGHEGKGRYTNQFKGYDRRVKGGRGRGRGGEERRGEYLSPLWARLRSKGPKHSKD